MSTTSTKVKLEERRPSANVKENNNNNINNNNGKHNGSNSKKLPSFSDLLWSPDIDGDVMHEDGVGGSMLAAINLNNEDSLEDLSDLVGPELASLVHQPKAVPVSTTTTTTTSSSSNSSSSPSSSSSSSNNNSSGGNSNEMPADISDLRSSDLLPTLPGMLDIDRFFADFQAGEHNGNNNHPAMSNANNNNNNNKSKKVIISRKQDHSEANNNSVKKYVSGRETAASVTTLEPRPNYESPAKLKRFISPPREGNASKITSNNINNNNSKGFQQQQPQGRRNNLFNFSAFPYNVYFLNLYK